MWSAGVIAYCLLAHYPPFGGKDEQMRSKIATNDYEFHENTWGSISPNAIKFIEKLIEPNMERRFSAAQALQHPFILESNVDALFPADTELLAKMTQVKPLTPFQQINMKILCELLSLVAFDFV